MAILKDLIVHGSSRFLNKIYASEILTPLIEAEAGIIKKLKADDVTVAGLLDVQGLMHTNSWTNSNIATIDGSFYITPTIECASGTLSSLTVNTNTPPKHSFVLTAATGSSFAVVNSLYYYDTSAHTVTWAKYSKVLITGEILVGGEWIPLGTILGQLNADGASGSISIINGLNNKHGTSTVLAELTSTNITSAEFRNLKISLYQRSGSTTTNTDAYKYPLGIYLTALGQNGKTFLDIYGGVNALTTSYGGYANPNVRIGNLSGLPAITTAAGNFTPVGWGIYTTNGYFSGTIVSNTGVIGGWKLGANSLYNGTTGLNNNTVGIYLGTDGIRNYSTSTQYVNITGGKIKALGVDLTGAITASSGSIGGWNIGTDTNKSLYYGNQTPGATTTNLILSPTSATNSNAIGGSGTGLTWFISAGKVFGVTTAGALYATSGKIGGWTIGTSSLYNGKTSYNNATEGLYLGTDYIAGGAGEEWWLKKDGSAKIGAMTLSAAGVLSVPAANITGTLTASQVDVSGIVTAGSIVTNTLLGGTFNTTDYIRVSTQASSALTIGTSGSKTDWRILAGKTFGVDKAGNMYATSATISGNITATSGTIGGILLDSNGKLWITDADISGTISGNHIDASSISIGSLSGASNYAQKTDVTLAIDNIEVGGRNLILQSSMERESPKSANNSAYVSPAPIISDYGIPLLNNTTDYFTYSFDYEVIGNTAENAYVYAQIKGTSISNGNPYNTKGIINEPVGRYCTTFKLTDTQANSTSVSSGIRLRNATDDAILIVKNIKLEKGNKATDWTPAPEDTLESISNVSTVANTALGQSVWYAECPTAAGTAVKVATVSPVTTAFPNPLVNGTTVNVKFTKTNSATNTSLKLNVNGTGEKSIKYIYNGAITDIVAGYLKANQMYQFRYDGTYWIVLMMRNTNDDHYDRSLYSVALAASAAISAGRIAVLGVDNKLHLLNTTSFNITCPPLYVATAYTAANVSSAATKTSNYTYWGTAFTLTDTHSIANAVANSNVYIVGTLSGDIFTPTTAVLTCAEPTTENGLYYMLLGRMSTPTKAILQVDHPIYVFKNGKFQKLEATTATNYITQINNTGIKITPYDKSGNDYLQLNSDAISMYRNNIETLRIEDSTIRVGKANEAHFSLTSSRLTGYGDNNNVYFDVGKGSNTTIQLFYGNGDRTSFEMGPLVKEIVSVKKENNTLTQGTDYTIDTVSIWYDIYFEQEPALNSTVEVSYESTNKEFIYTVGSSQNITTELVINPEGRYKTTIISLSAYEVRKISQKSSMGEDWWNPIYNYGSELEGNVYKYTFYTQTAIENGEKFKLTYLLSDDSNFTPDIETKEYTWDTSRQGSLNLTVSGVNEIQTVKVNNVSVNYTTEGPLYKDYIILNTALGQDEKIEVEFKTRNYNSEYYSTYFNFSNINKEDSVKGIGSASFGSENVNKGVFCLAEGVGNTVTGYASHAEGYNNVVAGSHAHAEGWLVKALGENSHAGGSNTTATGLNSFVHGNHLNAIYPNSAAFGYGNNALSQLFSIGMGLSQNAFSVNQDGDVQIGGRLLSGTTYENRIPLFKVVERTFTAHGIGRNGGMTRVRDITVVGYKPIAILGIVVGNSPGHPTSGQVDASWCVVPRFWIGYDYTNDHSNYKTDSIYYYIWNLFTGTNVSGGVTVDITFKFLYISLTAYMGLSLSQTTPNI